MTESTASFDILFVIGKDGDSIVLLVESYVIISYGDQIERWRRGEETSLERQLFFTEHNFGTPPPFVRDVRMINLEGFEPKRNQHIRRVWPVLYRTDDAETDEEENC